jgi:hypothetical protein
MFPVADLDVPVADLGVPVADLDVPCRRPRCSLSPTSMLLSPIANPKYLMHIIPVCDLDVLIADLDALIGDSKSEVFNVHNSCRR